jgi:hypothetical protein
MSNALKRRQGVDSSLSDDTDKILVIVDHESDITILFHEPLICDSINIYHWEAYHDRYSSIWLF